MLGPAGLGVTIMTLLMTLYASSCAPAVAPGELDKLGAIRITIKDQPFSLWIADGYAEQQQGLMHVTAEQMAPLPDKTERGMIFIFDHESELSFWMKNTIIPLDIAYLDAQGGVLNTYTMAALDERIGQYTSNGPARYAIEVNAGVWSRIGLKRGDKIQLPAEATRQR